MKFRFYDRTGTIVRTLEGVGDVHLDGLGWVHLTVQDAVYSQRDANVTLAFSDRDQRWHLVDDDEQLTGTTYASVTGEEAGA